MIIGRFFGKIGRASAVSVAILVAIGWATMSRPADAGGGWGGSGISPGAAVGLGLGAFALGSVLANPSYNPYYTATIHPLRHTIHLRRIIRPLGGVGAPITITITLVE